MPRILLVTAGLLLSVFNGSQSTYSCRNSLEFCRSYSSISLRAEVIPSNCDKRSINLIFTVAGAEQSHISLTREIDSTFVCLPKDFILLKRETFSCFINGSQLIQNRSIKWRINLFGSRCPSLSCFVWLDASIFNKCRAPSSTDFSANATVPQPYVKTTQSSTDFSANATVRQPYVKTTTSFFNENVLPYYSPMFLVIFFVLLAGIFFGNKRYQRFLIQKRKFYEIGIFPKISLTFYLTFFDEHPNHKAVVLRFADYLKVRFGFNVILELFDREAIYKDPAAWLEKSLASSDIILVIWSPGAEQRWSNSEKFNHRLDLFTAVLKRVKSDLTLRRNLSKYLFAYFQYHDNVPRFIRNSSIPCVKLMADFYSFCNKLIEFSKKLENFQKSKITFSADSIEVNSAEAVELERSILEMTDLITERHP